MRTWMRDRKYSRIGMVVSSKRTFWTTIDVDAECMSKHNPLRKASALVLLSRARAGHRHVASSAEVDVSRFALKRFILKQSSRKLSTLSPVYILRNRAQ